VTLFPNNGSFKQTYYLHLKKYTAISQKLRLPLELRRKNPAKVNLLLTEVKESNTV
jgi:hypothetical protein